MNIKAFHLSASFFTIFASCFSSCCSVLFFPLSFHKILSTTLESVFDSFLKFMLQFVFYEKIFIRKLFQWHRNYATKKLFKLYKIDLLIKLMSIQFEIKITSCLTTRFLWIINPFKKYFSDTQITLKISNLNRFFYLI